MTLQIIILVFLIVFSGFFVLSEMALVSSRRARLISLARDDPKRYEKVLRTSEDPSSFLSIIQIGVTLDSIISGAMGEASLGEPVAAWIAQIPALRPYASVIAYILIIVLITFSTIVFSELVPKRIALVHPEAIASRVLPAIRVIGVIFLPVERFLSWVTRMILKVLRVKASTEPSVTEDEIRVMMAEGTTAGSLDSREHMMLEGVLDLGNRSIEAFMTHRSDVEWLPVDTEEEAIRALLQMRYRYASIPVCDGSLDELRGIVDTHDLMIAFMNNNFRGLEHHMKKPFLVAGSKRALETFHLLKEQRVSLAIVIDEYGGVQGIVDREDLLDVIAASSDSGEQTPMYHVRDDGSYLVDGLMDVEEFLALFNLKRDEEMKEDFHTLAGLAIWLFGRLPHEGERVKWNNLVMEVVDMDGNRVDKILVFQKN